MKKKNRRGRKGRKEQRERAILDPLRSLRPLRFSGLKFAHQCAYGSPRRMVIAR
jgi:hypothetical protein